MEFVGNLRGLLVCVAQHDFGTGDDGTINPGLGSNAAGGLHHGAEVARGDAEAVGIKVELVLLATMLVDKVEEAIEDVFGVRGWGSVVAVAKELVVIMRNGGNQAEDNALIQAFAL